MQSTDIDDVVETMRSLSSERLAEVKDFVEFLLSKHRNTSLAEFLSIATQVESAGAAPLSDEEVEAEIKAHRRGC